jgi:hypothetical protein
MPNRVANVGDDRRESASLRSRSMPILRRLARSIRSWMSLGPRLKTSCAPSLLHLESRDVPSGPDTAISAFDVIKLNAMRQDPQLASLDGRLPGQSRNIGIAVIDTGLYGAHSAIRGNFKAFLDVNSGFFTVNPDAADAEQDPTGHGTHVASTAAGTNPNIAVAPGADLIGLGISGGDVLNNALSAMNWVLAHSLEYNIKVVNLSVRTGGDQLVNINNLSSATDSTGIAGLIKQLEGQGITVVAASGNAYAAFESPGAEVPAIYASLSVAATWEDNGEGDRFPFPAGTKGDLSAFDKSANTERFVSFSQRSSLPNQVAAPGATILGASVRGPDDYIDSAGTSMAAPMVSGLVAIMQDAAMTYGGRYLAVSDVVRIIRSTGDLIVDSPHDQNGYFDPATGRLLPMSETGIIVPRINVLKAVQLVRQEMSASKLDNDFNPTIATATVVPPLTTTAAQFQFGSVGSDGQSLVGQNDVDVYKITLTSPGQLAVSAVMASATSDLRLRLIGPDALNIPLTPTSNGSTIVVSAQILPAGDYYVGISGGSNTNYNIVTGTNRANGYASGDYKLTISLRSSDPDGTINSAQDLLIGSRLIFDSATNLPTLFSPGILGYNQSVDGITQVVGSADVNFYRWTAPDSGYVTIHTSSVDGLIESAPLTAVSFDTFLRVFLADGSPYVDRFGNAGINGDSNANTDSTLRLWVERGTTYFIGVSATGTSTGFSTPNRYDPTTTVGRTNPLPVFEGYYELTLAFDNRDGNGSPNTAQPLPIGATVNGVIGRNASGVFVGLDGRHDVNYYRVAASQDGLLDLNIEGISGFSANASLWLADDQDFPVELITNGTGSSQRWIVRIQAGNTYLLQLTGAENVGVNWRIPGSGTGGELGAYTLTTSLHSVSDAIAYNTASVATSLSIVVNQVLSGDLSSDPIGDSGTYINGSFADQTGQLQYRPADVDLYQFRAPFSGQVTVFVSDLPVIGELSDPVLVVFDEQGNPLTVEGLSGTGTGGKYLLRTEAFRTYYFGVTGRSAFATSYNIFTGTGPALQTATTGGHYLIGITDPIPDPTIPPVPPVPPPPSPPVTPPVVPPPPTFPGPPFHSEKEGEEVFPTVPGNPSPPVPTVPTSPTSPAFPPVVENGPTNPTNPTNPSGSGTVNLFAQNQAANRAFTINSRFGEVILLNVDRNELNRITPWPGFTGELRTTDGDFNNDGFPDIVVGTGPGTTNRVAIFDGISGGLIRELQPFEPTFTGGVFVAVGDLTGDGRADLVITPDQGGGPRVRVFDGANQLVPIADFYGIDDPNFRGGARASIGDLNRDGYGDLFIAAGFGGGPRIAIFSGKTLANQQRLLPDFLAFEPNVRNGVFLSVGDVTGDGVVDLAVGGGPSSGPRVTIFSGSALLNRELDRVADFFAGPVTNRGGVRLAIKDLDGDQQADLITTQGQDSSGMVIGYLGRNLVNGVTLPRVMATVQTVDGVYVG